MFEDLVVLVFALIFVALFWVFVFDWLPRFAMRLFRFAKALRTMAQVNLLYGRIREVVSAGTRFALTADGAIRTADDARLGPLGAVFRYDHADRPWLLSMARAVDRGDMNLPGAAGTALSRKALEAQAIVRLLSASSSSGWSAHESLRPDLLAACACDALPRAPRW